MSDDEQTWVLCAYTREIPIPRSSKERADCCGAPVWLSPDGQKFLTRNAGTKLLCLDCARGRPRPDEVQSVPGAVETVARITRQPVAEVAKLIDQHIKERW